LDLQLKTTSGDVAYITVESGISENMGIAVGISSIAALEPEISCSNFNPPPVTKTVVKIVANN